MFDMFGNIFYTILPVNFYIGIQITFRIPF